MPECVYVIQVLNKVVRECLPKTIFEQRFEGGRWLEILIFDGREF